jgi:LCP family protein required for cell wall assembly
VDRPADEEPEDQRPARHRSGRQLALLVVGVVAVFGCIAAAFGFATVWRKWGQFDRLDATELDAIEGEEQPRNFLIVGSDSREAIDASDPNAAVFTGGGEQPSGQRADTMIILRYDPANERLDILSVPRDLWVPIAGQDTTDRINTAYSHDDGPNTLIATIQESLGIPIHHYAEIDFAGFQDVVDEVGGVPMYFETIYQDTNSGFMVSEPGCITMGGQQALGFVRARHLQYMNEAGYWETDPTGDLGRISRQQVFIRNALKQARGSLSVLRPDEMNSMLDIGIDHVRLDQDLEPTELAAMGQRFAEFQGESIETHTLPVIEFTTDGGAAVVRLDDAAAQPVLNIFRGLPADHVDPTWVDLQIMNGSGVRGQAALVEEAYAAIGFRGTVAGDVPGTEGAPLEHTVVRYAPDSRYLAELVESHLTVPGELVEDPALSPAEVVLETGLDFTTVEQSARPESSDDGESTSTTEPDDATATTSTDAAGDENDGPVSPPTTVIGHVPGEPPEGVDCG